MISETSGSGSSHTAGHPEIDHRIGIEMTTGPLGQGFATGVGMAIAESHLRARLGADLVDHHTYGFVSDGDLMEGVSSEAASLAGHFGLGRLIYLYDNNQISIDGSTDITFSEDVLGRFDGGGVAHHRSRRSRPGSDRRGHRRGARRGGPALADLLSHPHRPRRAQRPGHRQQPMARPSAMRRSD